jgi:hypothetical protein
MPAEPDMIFYERLHAEGLISDASLTALKHRFNNPVFSVHWELKTLLYLGITLLTGGLGILVYKNIETIGHQAILLFIALVSAGCLFYCFKHKKPFNTAKVQSPNTFFDYVLLLGTLTLLIFVGYLQYQYQVFGTNYGLATFLPMLALFYLAYAFDHAGILTMAIINLGTWMGVSVTPRQLLLQGTFHDQSLINTYVSLGALLLLMAWLTHRFIFKKHFQFTYQHYGIHVSFISLLAGYFYHHNRYFAFVWLLVLLGIAWMIYRDAYRHKKYYFLVLAVLYSYFAVSCLMIRLLLLTGDAGSIILVPYYFVPSAIGVIYWLNKLHRQLKQQP